MKIEVFAGSVADIICDTLIISLTEGVTLPLGPAKELDEALGGLVSNLIHDQRDVAKFAATTVLHVCAGINAQRVVLLGLGKIEDLNADRLRAAAGSAIRAANKLESKTVASVIHGSACETMSFQQSAQSLVEGTLLGNYHFRHYKTDPKKELVLEKMYIVEGDAQKAAKLEPLIQHGVTIADAVALARDLVNHPANHMTPSKMAFHAGEIAAKTGLEISILDKTQIEELGMPAFLAVAQGSHEPPRLIVLKYNGAPNDVRLLSLVGKGITFDSGGISLKPSEGMHEMKDDMAGGAAVLGAIQAIAGLKLPVNILAIVPCTENLPSGYAFRPGDVISSMEGKTIEIISTDAEGRLILADAVTYARRLGATHIVDLATLTGACVVALGKVTSGVMGNNIDLTRQVLEASAQAGEKMWELPLFEEYKEQIKSEIADLKNTGGRPAGAITAGLFIASFVDKTPWVHIDIAGTVSSDKEYGYNVKGATGVGVRTLIQLAQNWGMA
ncbi:MAG: leucyl aminopeptidase [Negativicutes bacterium]|nr:leucyl aminopeptidase [Negativicutes bacterium]